MLPSGNCRFDSDRLGLTNIQYPPVPYGSYQSTLPKTLDPKAKRESTPGTNEILCLLPEENRDCTTDDTCNRTSKDEYTAKLCIRGSNGF